MNMFWVSEANLDGVLTSKNKKEYSKVNTIFLRTVIGVIVEHLHDSYLHHKVTKDLWDNLTSNYGGSDAGTELYIIE